MSSIYEQLLTVEGFRLRMPSQRLLSSFGKAFLVYDATAISGWGSTLSTYAIMIGCIPYATLDTVRTLEPSFDI